MLVLAPCGFYAAWTYQPGFKAIAQSQIDRVLGLGGMALPATSSPNPAKPQPRSVPQQAPAVPTNSNLTTATAPDSDSSSTASSTGGSTIALVTGPTVAGSAVTGSTTGVSSQSGATTVPAHTAASSTGPAAALAGNTVTAAPSVSKPENKSNGTKKVATASAAPAPLPGEDAAIILSSKGAEKRLAYSIQPKYPAEALPAKTEGTVVLKAVVDVNGKVDGVRLVEGNAGLANAAIEAVKQWRYRPYVRDGKPQSFQTVVIVDFQRP